jgi:hypothetical protein
MSTGFPLAGAALPPGAAALHATAGEVFVSVFLITNEEMERR